MAQEVRIAGATYSDVPSISVPDSNNVYHSFVDTSPTTATDSDVASGKIYFKADGSQSTGTMSGGGAAITVTDTTDTAGGIIRTITAVDISDTTAVASDVAQGKYFYTAAGVKTAGTASGGAGLEYESGTFSVTADIQKPTIPFTNTHGTPPDMVIANKKIVGEYAGATYETIAFQYTYFPSWTGTFNVSETGLRYGIVATRYHQSSATGDSGATYTLQYPTSDTGYTGYAYPRYWVSETGFTPGASGSTYTWKAGTTIEWIAVWAPQL